MRERPEPAPFGNVLAAGRLVICWCEAESDTVAVRSLVRRLDMQLRATCGYHGRLFWSRTACKGLGGVAVSVAGPIGIDAEPPGGPGPDASMLDLVATDAERSPALFDADAFLALWTRKEAVVKALGVGLALPPRHVHVGAPDSKWRLVDSPWGGQAYVRTLGAPGRYHAALATRGSGVAVSAFLSRWDGSRFAEFAPLPEPPARSAGCRAGSPALRRDDGERCGRGAASAHAVLDTHRRKPPSNQTTNPNPQIPRGHR